MNDYINFGLLALTSYLTLLNPLGIMPIFMTMTANFSAKEKIKTARKAYLISFVAVMIFAFTGQLLFAFFNITVESFKVVGGIIFFHMGMDMLNARLVSLKVSEENIEEASRDISVTPLAIPMICGPGTITNSIVLMEEAKDPVMIATLVVIIILVLFVAYLVLSSSDYIIKLMGQTGNRIMMRLMGLIIMVIAVEFLISGLRPILRDIFMVSQ